VKEDHWTYQLFLERPEIFLAIHEGGLKYARPQVDRLEQILGQLGVQKGSRLLDAPCGIGRHAVHFALRGWQVVGLELVPAYVKRAEELARELGAGRNLSLRVGDIREVGSIMEDEEPFDAILNLLTSIGYWDDETDLSILIQFHHLASSRGVLLVDTINRDYVIRHFQSTSFEEYGTVAYLEERRLDLESSRIRSRWTFFNKQGDDLKRTLTVDISQRIYSPHELRDLLEKAGWRGVKVYSGWDLKPLSSDVYRLLAVGRK
jgi:SAM-dependent methyltransferase